MEIQSHQNFITVSVWEGLCSSRKAYADIIHGSGDLGLCPSSSSTTDTGKILFPSVPGGASRYIFVGLKSTDRTGPRFALSENSALSRANIARLLPHSLHFIIIRMRYLPSTR